MNIDESLRGISESFSLVISGDLNKEAQHNMLAFSFDAFEKSEELIRSFILKCAQLYQKSKHENEMVFYSWLDELAGYIRVSAVSKVHGQLPFRCKLNICSLEYLVATMAIGSGGAYSKNGKLNVWQTHI